MVIRCWDLVLWRLLISGLTFLVFGRHFLHLWVHSYFLGGVIVPGDRISGDGLFVFSFRGIGLVS